MTNSSPEPHHHIRPKIRKKTSPAKPNQAKNNEHDDDSLLEETRQKMERWMGLHQARSSNENSSPMAVVVPAAMVISSSAPGEPIQVQIGQRQSTINNSRTIVPVSVELTQMEPGKATQVPAVPKSILRKPKYSKTTVTATTQQHETSVVALEQQPLQPYTTATTNIVAEKQPPQAQQPKKKPSIFKQDRIVERDPCHFVSQQERQQALPNHPGHAAVEGYQPKFNHAKSIKGKPQQPQKPKPKPDAAISTTTASVTKAKKDDEEPLIFNSLGDLMEQAGTLPRQDITTNSEIPHVVEAELSFACMSPEEYQRKLVLEEMEIVKDDMDKKKAVRQRGKKVSLAASEDDKSHDRELPVSVSDDDEGDNEDDDDDGSDIVIGGGGSGGGTFFDLMSDDEEEEVDEEALQRAVPRAFRTLWECLSPLFTPESIAYLKRLRADIQQQTRYCNNGDSTGSSYLITTTPQHDLVASRCNGFMAMLKMYLSRSLQELGQPCDMCRTVEQRLFGLLYTFNFGRPMSNLDSKQWKVMTCVLLEIVLFLRDPMPTLQSNDETPGDQKQQLPLPSSAEAVGMTLEEYHCLVVNTIRTFDVRNPVLGGN